MDTRMEPALANRSFKIMLAGASGAGKSSWVERLVKGRFEECHYPTFGAFVTPLSFQTSAGPVDFKVWDVAGSPGRAGLAEAYYEDAQGIIALYDRDHPDTLRDALTVIAAHPNIPVVLCRNKADDLGVGSRAISPGIGAAYCELSVKTGIGIEEPLLAMVRVLAKAPQLCVVRVQFPVGDTGVRVYMVLSELRFARGLRGVFASLDDAQKFVSASNGSAFEYIIVSLVLGDPSTERCEKQGHC